MEVFKYFFSYVRADSEFTLKLATELRAAGADLWIDQLDILGGQRWDRAVEEALKTCQGVIAVLSPESLGSDNVMDEISYALEEGKVVVPIVLRTCDIPFRLRRVQYIDFSTDYDTGFTLLVKALQIEGPSHLLEQSNTRERIEHDVNGLSEETQQGKVERKESEVGEKKRRTEVESIKNGEMGKSISGVSRKPNAVPLLLWTATAGYIGFTIFLFALLHSGEKPVALMFAANSIVLVIGCLVSYLVNAKVSKLCALGAAIQLVIVFGMLSMSIRDANILVSLSLGIAIAFLGMWSWYRSQERKEPNKTNRTYNPNQGVWLSSRSVCQPTCRTRKDGKHP